MKSKALILKSLSNYYYHIDNGGLGIKIFQDENKTVSIEMTASYFGHPDITSVLSLWGKENENKKILIEIGNSFLEAANKLQK